MSLHGTISSVEDALGWPVFGSGAGFASEAVVKGLQCSGPQGASHTLKPDLSWWHLLSQETVYL